MTGLRVLVLDDDLAVAATIERVAIAAGYDARHTGDPVEFLELVRTWCPDIVVVDLIIPGLDGIEVLAELAQRRSTAAVVIVTGLEARVAAAARRFAVEHGLGISGTLTKPFTRRQIESALGGDPRSAEAPREQPLPDWVTPEAVKAAVTTPGVLSIALQPKVHCTTGALGGFEALVRWIDPGRGPVPAGPLVALAEEYGLIADLTERVLELSLPWFAGLGLPPGPQLSINLSGASIDEDDLVARLDSHCLSANVDPAALILELTETSRYHDTRRALGALTQLRIHGFHLSLDDFGVGYSSLTELTRQPFSEVKVDRQFVSAAVRSEDARSVVRSVVDLARGFDLQVTAEGVEDQPTLDLMRYLGVDLVQGYHLARPLSPEAARSWLESR